MAQEQVFPVMLPKQRDPSLDSLDFEKWYFGRALVGIVMILLAAYLHFIALRPSSIPIIIGIGFAWLLLATILDPYVTALLRYELRKDGVFLQSMTRKRTIRYVDIEQVMVVTGVLSRSWRLSIASFTE